MPNKGLERKIIETNYPHTEQLPGGAQFCHLPHPLLFPLEIACTYCVSAWMHELVLADISYTVCLKHI